MSKRRIGFDLDGCLAKVDTSKPYDGSIGDPNRWMVDVAKRYIDHGWDVVVFTARVASPIQVWEGYDFPCEEYAIRHQRNLIRDWTLRHLGVALESTAVKDHTLVAIFDDRAVHVAHNGAWHRPCEWLESLIAP